MIDVKEKLGQDDGGLWQTSVGPEERVKVAARCAAISDWIDEEVGPATPPKVITTGLRKFLCTWFGEVCSCCSLSLLPQLACNILATMYKQIFSALYRDRQKGVSVC